MNSIRKQCLVATAGAVASGARRRSHRNCAAAERHGRSWSWMQRPSRERDLHRPHGQPRLLNQSLPRNRRLPELGLRPRCRRRGVHAWGWRAEPTSLSAFVEGTSYFNEYGVKSIFSRRGDTQRQVSEKVSLFGSAGVSGDIAGQLSNRFLYVPPVAGSAGSEVPPPPVTVNDPDVFSFTGRQYRVYGQAGASIRTSAAGQPVACRVAPSAPSTRTTCSTITPTSSRTARTTIRCPSGRLSDSRSARPARDYDDSSDNSTIINPAVTVRTLLSESWDASGGGRRLLLRRGGSARRKQTTRPTCRSTARICRTTGDRPLLRTRLALCHIAPQGRRWSRPPPSASTGSRSSTRIRRCNCRPASCATILQLANSRQFQIAPLPPRGQLFSRRIGQRLSVGADIGARALRQDGPDPDTDISGSLFVRYRLGDLG